MKQLPIGNDDFKSIREDGHYYVDKSMLIADILGNNPKGAYLFTRPRRFGKSLNLSMLDAFFNIRYKDRNTWFEGLEISEHHEFDRYRNAFPTVYIKLKDLDTGSYERFLKDFKSKLNDLFREFLYLRESDALSPEDKALFTRLYAGEKDESDCCVALGKLVTFLRIYHNSKVVVLIDEYDNAMNHAYGTETEDQVRRFVSNLLSPVLKSNEAVQLSVVTGVMQIAKESIFSGVNNLKVDNILSTRSGERFGFTGPEVERLCSDYGHPEKYGEARDWYDGYRFGNADVYNPWSVLNYVDEGFVAKAYWAGTSGNDIIPRLLDNADIKTYGNLEKLGRRDPVTIQMNETVAYSQLTTDSDTLFSVMAMSGYLNAVRDEDNDVALSIPNRELCSVFSYEMLKRVISDDKHVPKFMNALLRCDVEKMGLHLGALTDTILSVRHLGDGKTHHAFLAGLLTAAATCYDITTDREGGDGYPDIMMRCVRGNTPHVIIEVKETSDKDRWDSVSKEALKQIHDKEYYRGLKGKVILYGVAFYLKTPKITSEIIDR